MMQDDEIALFNACTDLVGAKKYEAFPRHLLTARRPSEWVRVTDCCRQLGIASGDVTPEVFAAWLTDPLGHDGYAVVLFYDDESKWSTAAHYNRGRLLGDAPTTNGAAATTAAPLAAPQGR